MFKHIRLLAVAAVMAFAALPMFASGATAASNTKMVPVEEMRAAWNTQSGVGEVVIVTWRDSKNTRLTGSSKIHGFNVYRGNKYLGTVIPKQGQKVFFFADRDGVASEDSRYRVQPVRANSSKPGGWEWGPFAWTSRFSFPVF